MAKRKTKEEFIANARRIHGDKYDYSKVEYVNTHTKVCIICPEHGEFWQSPNNHTHGTKPQDCPLCKHQGYRHTNESFIKKAQLVHGDLYDYSQVNYINAQNVVDIICRQHGLFQQNAHNHLKGAGCPVCGGRMQSNVDEFIQKSRKIHGDKYDYSKVVYSNNKAKVCIICPEHGEFWQKPNGHLGGKGCPLCYHSKLEDEIYSFLQDNKFEFIPQYTCDWLGRQSLDFFIPSLNIGIECQGEQHFKPVEAWGGKDMFLSIVKRDKVKLRKCQENNVKLLYYSNLAIKYPYDVFTDKEQLLYEISKTI